MTGKPIALEPEKAIERSPVDPVWRKSIPSQGDVEMEESPSVTRLFGMTIDNKYRIEDMIGRGGMGVVYRAEHTGLRRKVAIKVLLRGHGAGSDAKKRFERSVRLRASRSVRLRASRSSTVSSSTLETAALAWSCASTLPDDAT